MINEDFHNILGVSLVAIASRFVISALCSLFPCIVVNHTFRSRQVRVNPVCSRHTDKSRSSRYRDIGNLAVPIAISGK